MGSAVLSLKFALKRSVSEVHGHEGHTVEGTVKVLELPY